jgi:hypothetical protein
MPRYFELLPYRVLLGVKALRPLLRIKGEEAPEAAISFYEGEGRCRKRMKFAWITSSRQIGSRLLSISNQNYETIFDGLSMALEKTSSLAAIDYLKERGARADLDEFDRILAAVPDVEADAGDRLEN